MKENFKNKRQRACAKKADGAVDVAKVRQKVESKRRGEGRCPPGFTLRLWRGGAAEKTHSVLPHAEPLMKPEEKGSGEVSWSVYGAYIRAAGGPVVFIINAFLFLSTTGSIAFSNWWLSHWIKQGSGASAAEVRLPFYAVELSPRIGSAPPLPRRRKRSARSNRRLLRDVWSAAAN